MAIADRAASAARPRLLLRDDAKSVELRKQYVEHIGKMAALRGDATRIGPPPPRSRR